MKELRKVDTKEFECGGILWKLNDIPSFARYARLQVLNFEFMFSKSIIDFLKEVRNVKEKMNKLDFVAASVGVYNIERGICEMDKKYPIAWKMCALFINEQGEDLSDASDAIIDKKVNIWAKELDPTPFFHLAVSICPDWIAAFRIYSQNISSQEMGTNEKST